MEKIILTVLKCKFTCSCNSVPEKPTINGQQTRRPIHSISLSGANVVQLYLSFLLMVLKVLLLISRHLGMAQKKVWRKSIMKSSLK